MNLWMILGIPLFRLNTSYRPLATLAPLNEVRSKNWSEAANESKILINESWTLKIWYRAASENEMLAN